MKKKIIILLIVIVLGWILYSKLFGKKSNQIQYQTAQAEKGTLIVSISTSGQVSSVNSASISTQASGVVSKVYVENGQTVQSGTPIAEIDLDLEGKQRSTQAYASYQNAKNSLDSAKANLFSMQSDMLTNWQTFMDKAQSATYQNPDGSPKNSERQLANFVATNDDWLSTEAKYKNQQNVINQAQTALNSSWLSYQQSSSTVYAPISGTVTGLSLQIGSVLTTQSGSSGNITSQKIASIKTNAVPTISFNLTEIDILKIKIGNKATVSFDAIPEKTFTGTVVSVDTIGSISSGVTTYPAVIKLDSETPDILSNMSAQANIITHIKDNVILIPSSAVQTQNQQSVVRVMKNGQPQEVNIETGLSSDSQIEIVSGITEGDTIVTSTISNTSTRSSQTQSIFGGFGGGNTRGRP